MNRYATLPGSAIVPPLRVNATRTSRAARLRLSVRHSMSIATPFGPYPSYVIVWYSAPPVSAPEPRLTARSMLSLGTDDFFAFWIASYSVGLPAGSPPPVRAATSMFLISLANILPRLASTTAFLCFVVAHLEWPDIGAPSGQVRRGDPTAGGRQVRSRTICTNSACTRRSPVTSGWNDVASSGP